MDKRKGEMSLDNSIPEAPEWMSPEALVEWGRLTSNSKYVKALSTVDRGMMAVYCTLWSRFVAGEKSATASEFGHRMTPTEVMAMINVGAKLGLNPSDRVKLRLESAEAKPTNKFAKLNG